MSVQARRVVITAEDYKYDYDIVIDYFKKHGIYTEWRPSVTKTPEEIMNNAKGFDAILAAGDKYNKQVLSVLSDTLKIIARFGTGCDSIDIETATKLGIAVTNVPGKLAGAVAEFALLLMLNVARRGSLLDYKTKNGEWWRCYAGTQLENRTVGLVGFGHIAAKLAKYLKGFSCKIIAYDKFFNREAAEQLSVEFASLDEIAQKSDYVSLHVPITDETRGMIDKKFFSKMKSTAYLINTCRGAVIKEKDLIEALKQNKIAGAGLDVFEKEPLDPKNPLLKMDNVVVSPHVAAATMEAVEGVSKCAADNIIAYFEGKQPPNIVNPDYVKFKKKS